MAQCRTLGGLAIHSSRWWVLQGLFAVSSVFCVMNLAERDSTFGPFHWQLVVFEVKDSFSFSLSLESTN